MERREGWLHSLQPVLSEIERYVRWADEAYGMHLGSPNTEIARQDNPDAPNNLPLLVVVQTRGRKAQYGHFRPDAWTAGETGVNEVSIAAEDLRRPIRDVLTTVHHEVLHYFAWQRGLKDTSKSGRHNKVFKGLAEEFGMEGPDVAGPHGWDAVVFTDEAWRMVEDGFVPDGAVFDLARRVVPIRAKSVVKMKKWTCGCVKPTIVRCATKLVAVCTLCGEEFTTGGEE